jgi:poly-beta-1,6-N-acetyl-D-glucosamine synthase
MSLEQGIVPALIFTGAVGAAIVVSQTIAANVYEAREYKKHLQRAKHPHARRHRARPLISIIVLADNDAQTIIACLDSVIRNAYRKIEIIVVDNSSADDTGSLLRRYIREHPRQPIRLIAKRQRGHPALVVGDAFRKYGHGQLVMVLGSDQKLAADSLHQAVQHFNSQPELEIVMARREAGIGFTLAGLLSKYLAFLQTRRQKLQSLVLAPAMIPISGILGRPESLLPLIKTAGRQSAISELTDLRLPPSSQRLRYHYADNVTVYIAPTHSFKQLCRQYLSQHAADWQTNVEQSPGRAPRRYLPNLLQSVRLAYLICLAAAGLLLPVLIGYFIYLAASLHEPALLLTSLAGLSIFLVAAIWDDRRLKLQHKIAYLLGLPPTYGLFYLLLCVQMLAIGRVAVVAFGRSTRRLPQLIFSLAS